jgi:hypothetical protein
MYAPPDASFGTGARRVGETRDARYACTTERIALQFSRRCTNQHSIRVFALSLRGDCDHAASARQSKSARLQCNDEHHYRLFGAQQFFTTNRCGDAVDTPHSLKIERISADRFAAPCPL